MPARRRLGGWIGRGVGHCAAHEDHGAPSDGRSLPLAGVSSSHAAFALFCAIYDTSDGVLALHWVLLGWGIAQLVKIVKLPQMVAAFHSLVRC
jgi:hypothetical protein